MKKFAIVLAVMLGIFCLNGLAFSDTIVQNTVPKERTTFSEYEEALDHYNKGEYQKSINILKDYIKQTPDPWGYWLMGYSLYKLKRFDEANEYFKNAYLVDPSFSPTPTLEKELKAPYKPARPEGYPEGSGPSAGPTPMPKLQQGTIVITESGPVVPTEKPAAPTPVPTPAPEPAPTTQAQVPPSPAPTPVPAPGAPAQVAPEAVPPPAAPGAGEVPPPPAAPQAVPAPAQPEAPQQVTPPPPPAPKPTPQPAPRPKPIQRQPQQPEMPFSPDLIAGLGTTMLLAIAGIGLLVYLFFCYCYYRIAKKLDVSMPWLAFVPILQIWTVFSCAGKSIGITILLILLMFVPLINLIVIIYVWMMIAENLGKNKWLGLLILVPLVNVILLAWFAFSRAEGPAMAMGQAGGMGDMSDLSGEPDIPDLDFDLEEEPAPKAKGGAQPKEPSSYEDDWQMPDEDSTGEQSVDDWQLPEENTEGEQSVDDWQLPQDDDELK